MNTQPQSTTAISEDLLRNPQQEALLQGIRQRGQKIAEEMHLNHERESRRREAITSLAPLPDGDPRAVLAEALQVRKSAEEVVAQAEAAHARAQALLDQMKENLDTAHRNAAEAAEATAAALVQAMRYGEPGHVPDAADGNVQLVRIEAEHKHSIAKKAVDCLAGELVKARTALQAVQLRVEAEIGKVVYFEVARLANEFKASLRSALQARQKALGVGQKYPLSFEFQEAFAQTLDSLSLYQPINERYGAKHQASWQSFIAELQQDAAAELNF
jgi:hypothetical protein